jgi:uncharacterized damage-inducible protein DinB
MNVSQYIIELWNWNSSANRMVLNKMKELPDKSECVRFYSHLINCQYKWMNRLQVYPECSKLDWWEPLYSIDQLDEEWNESVQPWMKLLDEKSEEELMKEVTWVGNDGITLFTAQLKDIALQLNYHSIHHRAQMQTIIRKQGLEPDFVDYIGTKVRKAEVKI